MDATTQLLVAALKQALTQPGEQRLYRSGKLPGIFASKSGASGEAATQALRDGLLEITRTETKGKTATEFVQVTPRALEFVHGHESPVQALRDLQADLKLIADRIETLSRQVSEAVHRAEAAQQRLPGDLANAIPWTAQALQYLEQRHTAGMVESCPLPELFTALRQKQPELTLADFHAGLRRLYDRGVLRLVPYQEQEPLPEPEYALLDGAATFYHVGRG